MWVLACGALLFSVSLIIVLRSLAVLARQGKTVGILHLTRGEMGTRGTAEERIAEAQAAARALGAAIRLACDLSGRSPELLQRSSLDIRASSLVIEAEEESAPLLLGEQTAKRATTLAALLERELKLRPASRRERAKPEKVA